MNAYKRTVSLLAGAIIAYAGISDVVGQPPKTPEALFEQLQDYKTTDAAAEQFLRLHKADPKIRDFLVARLPTLLEKSRGPFVWGNAARMAGELTIVEAAPALARGIDRITNGTITMGSWTHFKNRAGVSALLAIGEPAVPAVVEVLKQVSPEQRRIASFVLANIGSEAAVTALKEAIKKETDPQVREYMEKQLLRDE